MAAEQPHKRPAGAAKRKFPRPFGRYILEKTLSRGGMGEVFLAVVKRLEQRCVIKTIRGDLTGEEEFVGRFADEAKILVHAAHDNIIRYFDAGRVASDYYIAMEFVHGRDLGDVLDRAYERGEPMPSEIGLYVAAQLLEGLHYAHELTDEQGRRMGLVHRDISPQNVLIGFDGSVKLIDFGLARTDLLPNRTQGALAVGKYGYMSPEQARHEPLDGRADVYSAGVMLFEVFTGDRLVDEQEQATLWQRVLNPRHRSPRSVLPSLPREIDELVMTAVSVDPRDRFPSAHAMAERARHLLGPRSRREELQTYLRHLYPRVDFSPPPLPNLTNLADGDDRSIIFATSRDGARSVFGRGELPIEGTMQIDARDVRAEIERRRRLAARDPAGDTPDGPALTTQAIPTERPAPAEPRIERTGRLRDPAESDRGGEQPTQVARFPVSDDEATAFMRAPDAAEGTLKEAPLLSRTGLSSPYVDDEQTVMMSAPPSAIFESTPSPAEVFDPGAPADLLFAEDTGSEATELGAPPSGLEEPTQVPLPNDRPSRSLGEARVVPSVLPDPGEEPGGRGGRRRAIRERVRTGARQRDDLPAARGERFSPPTVRNEPAASQVDEPTRVPAPRPEGPLEAGGLSVFLLGGLIFGAAAVVVIVFLLST